MEQTNNRNRKGQGGLDYWEEPRVNGGGLEEREHLSELAESAGGESIWSMTLLGFTLAALGVAVYYLTRKREIPERITEYARTHWLH